MTSQAYFKQAEHSNSEAHEVKCAHENKILKNQIHFSINQNIKNNQNII